MVEFDEHAARSLVASEKADYVIIKGDARRIPLREDSVDMVCTHPPYGPAIKYTAGVEGDLSRISVHEFLDAMKEIAREFSRVLKTNRHCVILIGDYRSGGSVEPLGFRVFSIFKQAGFRPEEIIIKAQYQDSSTGFYYGKTDILPFLIAHEYLLVFRNDK
jgi:tRNA G10  N-methylase Trm11